MVLIFYIEKHTGGQQVIRSKADLKAYMDADACAMGRVKWSLRASIFDMEWRYERALRQLEYLTNC